MKRVGIICDFMVSYGGVQTCVVSLIKGLNEKGIEPVLLCDATPWKKLWEEQNLKCDVQKINYSISPDTMKKYAKYLNSINEFSFYFKTSWIKGHFDFLYIFQHNIIVDSATDHVFYLSMSPRAYNYSKNSFLTNIKNSFYNLFLKRIHPVFEFQRYNCVINSRYTAGMFSAYYKKPIEVVYPSNSFEKFVPASIVKKEKTVLFLSRITPDKNAIKIIELAKMHRDYSFSIAGSINTENLSYLEMIKREIAEHELNNVEIFTNQSLENIVRLLTSAEYYVFTAENEHFGITTVEAILFGCIPFVHNSGGQKEIVPIDMLRFEFDDMIAKFNLLININQAEKNDLKNDLKDHVQNFTEDKFITRMVKFLP